MSGKEPVYIWRYVLRSRAALNSRSTRREFEGALVRIGDGFGCLHPWPELGDQGLGELLEDLKGEGPGSGVAENVVRMAARDAEWRRRGKSMLDEVAKHIPESHATLPECTEETVGAAVSGGFSVLKIKGRRDFPELAGRMDEVSRRWPHLMWRVDFNGTLSKEETLCFVQCLTDHVWKRIDFIEDPCPWNPRAWSEIRRVTSLQLALDRGAHYLAREADVLVMKPARFDSEDFAEGLRRLVVTSNMDHPLGQCYAAWRAGTIAASERTVDVCGLQTHGLFEPDAFSERLGAVGPQFRSPGGTGLGFDDLLQKLPWTRLK